MAREIKPITIAIDFDGTCTTHEFPQIGKEIGAVHVLKRLTETGHQLILFTMRSNQVENSSIEDNQYLDHAIQWFSKNDIPLHGIQTNPNQKNWTSSPKCYAQLYIDDAALGAPLKRDESLSDRPFIDWDSVEAICEMDGILTPTNEFIAAMREDMINNGQKSNLE